MRRVTIRTAVIAGFVVGAIGSGEVTASNGQASLAAVRAATAHYHRLDAAQAAGYVDLQLCFDQMGEHFGRPEAIGDGVLEATEPEALVYAHVKGRLRLVAVEYVSTGPGEVLGMPLHFNSVVQLWVLHAWVWKGNPDGIHADTNPLVGDCP